MPVRSVSVQLGSRSYTIKIGPALLQNVGPECARLKPGERCAIITDKNAGKHFAKTVFDSLVRAGFSPLLVTVPAGERAKSLRTVAACYDQLAAHRLERKSLIIALGGGVVGDLAGFVAATYLRGIPFVQAPTTLLAQVDSSVGGKTGVNLRAEKILLVLFISRGWSYATPKRLRHSQSGNSGRTARSSDTGIIYDARFFASLERNLERILNLDEKILAPVIARCCEIKADVVSQDETESGLRAILNFGHTIGHAIENSFGYGKHLHGEAISIGQILAARLSEMVLGMPGEDVHRIEALFSRAGLPTQILLNPSRRQKLFAAMRVDKKTINGEVRFVLARKIGQVEFGKRVSTEALDSALRS